MKIEGASNRVTFAPHLPPDWGEITLRHVRVGSSEIAVRMIETENEVRLQVNNDGAPVTMVFDPQIPIGAVVRSAHIADRLTPATLERNSQDTHARVDFRLPHGTTILTLRYTGGVALIPPLSRPLIGLGSNALRIAGVELQGRVLSIDFDRSAADPSAIMFRTAWTPISAEGATFEATAPNFYRLTLKAPPPRAGAQRRDQVSLTFADVDQDYPGGSRQPLP